MNPQMPSPFLIGVFTAAMCGLLLCAFLFDRGWL